MELRQLRYFVAVAEEGNFSRAAERLHVSQPPLSTQIKALERELGARLLERDNRGATLTPAGEIFLGEARAVLHRLGRAAASARDAGAGEHGVLVVGFVSLADFGVLPGALKAYRTRHPQVEVQLREMTTDEQRRALRDGSIDLGIGLGPMADPHLTFHALARESLVVALPAGHPLLRARGAVDARRLADEEFIVPPRELAPGLDDLIRDTCRAAGFVPRVAQQARQMQTVVSLVAGGMGVALVPESLRRLARTGVVYRPLRGRYGKLEIGALIRSREDSPLVTNFMRVLKR